MAQFIDDSLLKDYFDEAFSQIEIIEDNLLIIEKDPINKDAIDSLFRAAHTLKGGSATVQMDEITDFTHLLEDVLDDVRENKIKINENIVDIMLNALDLLKNMINARSKGNVYNKDYSDLTNKIKQIIEDKDKKESKSKSKTAFVNKKDPGDSLLNDPRFKLTEYDILEINDSNNEKMPLYKIIVVLDEANPMKTVSGIQIFTALRDIGVVLKTVPEFDELYSDNFYKEIMYILASDSSREKIKEYLNIPDTTEKVIVESLESSQEDEKPVLKKTSVKDKEEIKEIKKENFEIKEDFKIIQQEENIKEELSEEKQKIDIDQAGKASSSSVLRVDSVRIDLLLNLVSEVVINKAFLNQINMQFNDILEHINLTNSEYKDNFKQFNEEILHLLGNQASNENIELIKNNYVQLTKLFDPSIQQLKLNINRLKSNSQSLDRISSLLQEGVMKVRMVPVKQIFNRFPRLVRDLSKRLNKKIDIILKGEDTEVDKAMIDYLSDPLIHIVRNSIDHGIESPDEREKAGKSSIGKLELTAASEGNIINIIITDDGKGIDVEKVKKVAIRNNLINDSTILSEQDAFNLIFEPGFTTAEEVTSVSGRGVGLDVVKKNIEILNGSIKVTSKINVGTTFNIKLPLTLAIIQGLMIEVLKEKYIIPISSVIESLRINPKDIKSIDNYEVINVRDEILSLIKLSKLFKYEEDKEKDFYFIVIVGSGNKKIGLVVDNVIGEEDIVIKPLKDKYTNTPGIAGATILGDGTVSLIINVSQLIELGEKLAGIK